MWRGRDGRKGRRGWYQREGLGEMEMMAVQRTPGNGASRLGGQSAGKSRPFGASDLEWCSTNRGPPGPPFTPLLVSHMNIQSRPTDRQSAPPARARSQRSIWAHKYSRFVVAANQGLIRLLSLLSSRPLERKMTEKVCFPSLFSPGFAIFDDITRNGGRGQMRSDAS